MNHEFAQILGASLWWMQPTAFRAMVKRAETATPDALQAAAVTIQAYLDREPRLKLVGDVAVIEMAGPITYKRSPFSWYFGGATIEEMQAQFRLALSDAAVKTIVFHCDTPGGCVDFVPEFADEIFAARGTKPLLAVADTMICSAGYWLTAQCEAIYATRSSMIGSIGTYVEHDDISEMLAKAGVKITLIAHPDKKIDGNPYEPLSETARADYQAWVDEVGLEFEAAVVRGRGVPKAKVLEWTQLGIPPRGKRAIALGLADKAGTFDSVLAKLTKGRSTTGARASLAARIAANLDEMKETLEGKAAIEAKAEAAVGCSCSISCPCQDGKQDWCPEDCETCDPACPCQQQSAEAKATAAAATVEADARTRQAQADVDLIETTRALVR